MSIISNANLFSRTAGLFGNQSQSQQVLRALLSSSINPMASSFSLGGAGQQDPTQLIGNVLTLALVSNLLNMAGNQDVSVNQNGTDFNSQNINLDELKANEDQAFQKLARKGRTTAKTVDTNINYKKLNNSERTDLSNLTDRERAIVHLWGRQMIANGQQDGGILLTVKEAQATGKNDGTVDTHTAEQQLADELIAKDKAEYGGVTGKSLDQEFFKVFKKMTGRDISAKYADAPVHFATGPAKLPTQFSVDNPQWEQALEDQNGLNQTENDVLRLWGHNPLISGGKVDGSILAYTLASPNALDKGMDKSDVKALLNADLASDGVVNGDSLSSSFDDVMDKLYLGTGGTDQAKIKSESLTRAQKLHRSAREIALSVTKGSEEAIRTAGQTMKDHPVLTGMSAASLVAAAVICPFLAGLGAGAAGAALGQKLLSSDN